MEIYIVMSAYIGTGTRENVGVEVVFSSSELADAFIAVREEDPDFEDFSFWVEEKTVVEE